MKKPLSEKNKKMVDLAAEQLARIFIEQALWMRKNKLKKKTEL